MDISNLAFEDVLKVLLNNNEKVTVYKESSHGSIAYITNDRYSLEIFRLETPYKLIKHNPTIYNWFGRTEKVYDTNVYRITMFDKTFTCSQEVIHEFVSELYSLGDMTNTEKRINEINKVLNNENKL